MKQTIWPKLQTIDRRVIYGLLLAAILIPLFCDKLPQTIIPDPSAVKFYDTIERIARESPNKLVIVDAEWTPSTRGENKWQSQAIITHLMQRHLHFALLTFNPQNNGLMQGIVDDLAKKYDYKSGRDYVNWGYRPEESFIQTLKGLVNDIPGTIRYDWKRKDLASIPVMHGVKDIKDISAIVEITATSSVDAWIGLVQSVNKTPLLYAPTAISAPKHYAHLDSGQIAGMLTGVKGAGDYEKLVGAPSFGTRATGALSFVYALIIALIVLGNIGYHGGRMADRKAGR